MTTATETQTVPIEAITFRQDRDLRGRPMLACNMCDEPVSVGFEANHIDRHRSGEID